MTQFLLALFGLTALAFAMGSNPLRRKWAPVVGLAGQPFWFLATVPSQQWGMVALCCAYTALYLLAVWKNWAAA